MVINTKVSVKNCAHLKPKTHARKTNTGPIITKVSVKNCAHLKPKTHARDTNTGPIITTTKGANGNGSMYLCIHVVFRVKFYLRKLRSVTHVG
jgi:hypothetical protein